MAMIVKNNMSALSTLNTLNKNQSALKSSLEKVSSGMKINSAQDDASGYAISERMRAMIRSLDQANENAQNGNSLMKVAEGAVAKTVEIIDTLKKKAIAAATDTKTDDDRATIQKEIDQLIDQIDENALVTYNGKYLLDGSKTQAGSATFTAMTNQKLAKNTTGATKLVELANRKGENLEIIKTDQVTASFVMNGKTYTTNYFVGDSTVEDIFEKLNAEAVDKGVGRAFGPARLNDYEEMTYSDATSKLATDCATAAVIVQTLKDTTSNAAKDYVRAAMAIEDYDESAGGLGSTTSKATYQDVSSARADLEASLEQYFGGFTLAASDVKTADLELQFVTYDADGKSDTSKFKFSYDFNGGMTGVTLTNIGGIEEMVDALSASINNLLSVGVRGGDNDASLALSASNFNLDSAVKTALAITKGSLEATAVDQTGTTPFTSTALLCVGSATGTTFADWQNSDILSDTTSMAALASTSAPIVTGKSDGASTSGTVTSPLQAFDSDSMNASTTYESIWSATDGAVAQTDIGNNITRFTTGFVIQKLAGLVHDGTDIGLNPASAVVNTADSTIGLTVTARNSGLNSQISGLTIKISDAQGQSRTAINEVLDAFGTTIFAANKSEDSALKFHTGAEAGQALSVGLSDMRAAALGLKGNDSERVSVATQDKANAAISVFNNALQKALDIQTTIGSIEARLNYTSDNLTTATENITASESTIRDADLAKEMTEYTKNNVLLQAAQSMLAQANQNSSAVLSLLQ
jgi:flagellin